MRMFLFLLLVQFVSTASASRTDSILTILDSELGKKMEYRMEKGKTDKYIEAKFIRCK